jgi:hypothetical protein
MLHGCMRVLDILTRRLSPSVDPINCVVARVLSSREHLRGAQGVRSGISSVLILPTPVQVPSDRGRVIFGVDKEAETFFRSDIDTNVRKKSVSCNLTLF